MRYYLSVCLWLLCLAFTASAAPTDALEKSFVTPPDSARPWVYWFWMDGNVSKEGITADLEAMNRIGIGGALMMGVGLGTPPGEVDFNSPLYHEMYAHAAKECLRLGMKLSLHQCDGWATAGGPWITPERSMKMLVWTTKEIDAPVSGPIQLKQPLTKENFYEDISVLAVPLGAKAGLPAPVATADGKPAPALTDGNYQKGQELGKKTELRFDVPRTVSALVFQLQKLKRDRGANTSATIQVSTDGESFRQVATIDLGASIEGGGDQETMTVSFAPETARAVRILMGRAPAFEVGEIEVPAEPRVNLWEVKSGRARKRGHGGETTLLDGAPVPPDVAGINPDQILDLSGKISADGTLDWVPPAGRWLLVRAGFTSTAKSVKPATRAGGGLEADKMSGEAIRFHFDSFAKGMIAENNVAAGNPIYSVHADSWEAQLQTWSSYFREEFEKRRGYSMTKWLPVLTSGLVIGSAEESERFLWDVRRTMADLIRDNYYGEMQRMCHESGVLFQSEAAGAQMFMYDPINYKSRADIPIGEFWLPDDVREDCKVAASVAHIYNRPIAAAEAFTSKGGFRADPFTLKVLGDRAFCTGINRYIIHRYCMQPFNNVEPGLTFGPFGINFERTQTWWENGGKAWVEYVTRCQSLLQSGSFVADVIHYIGDDAPNYLGHREDAWNPIPAGYDFDGCNLEILKQLAVDKDGSLVLPHGMRYRVLLLPNRDHMTLEALQKVEQLVRDGATAIGPRPLRTPGLKDAAKNDAALGEITGRVWGKIDGKAVTENRYGKGRMIYGPSLKTVLAGIAPADFDYSTEKADSTLRYIHRKTDEADFYFVASDNSESALDATVRFRVTGKAPELWDASTGKIKKAHGWRTINGVTELPIHFDPAGSWFVVFREAAQPPAGLSSPNAKTAPSSMEITGPWTVSFPPGKQAPASLALAKLVSWTDCSDEGVKYFSGTATYRTEFDWKPETGETILNLGTVKNVAEVALNGSSLGTLWKPPYQVDVAGLLKPGKNNLEIKVTNLWPNRLIGDEKLHPDPSLDYSQRRSASDGGPLKSIPKWVKSGGKSPAGRTTFVLQKFYDGTEPLLESGLLGPVTLQAIPSK